MRVSHSNLYANFIENLNNASGKLMELNMKASSQKRINKPSDSPVDYMRVLNYRDSIDALKQYQKNIDTGKGWLSLADETMMQAQNMLTRTKELAEQAATGTITKNERDIIAKEARQIFNQMINLANTEYEGKSIFGGQKVEGSAFTQKLYATERNVDPPPGENNSVKSIEGSTDKTILIQFLETKDIGVGDGSTNFQYSIDGGSSWKQDTIPEPAAGDSPKVTLSNGVTITFKDGTSVQQVADAQDTTGSWVWIRPSAQYNGDDNENIEVENYSNVTGEATGNFKQNTLVRIDSYSSPDISYSYSSDGGQTWETGNIASDTELKFLVPGGKLETTGVPTEGDQFVIRPSQADIDVEISPDEMLTINNVGKDVFGGIFKNANGNEKISFADENAVSKNIFETMGKFIGYLETNNQDGVQEALENITDSTNHLSNKLADVGARESRLESSKTVLSGLELDQKERMSNLEDVDVAELMTELANQEMIYQAVLKSSSTIMRMNLVNYV